MSTFILKNSSTQSEVAARDISYAIPDPLNFDKLQIRNDDITGISSIETFLYTSDDLVFSFLLAGAEESLSHRFDNYNVTINALVKYREFIAIGEAREADKFKSFRIEYDRLISQENKISLKIKQSSIDAIRSDFSLNGLVLPDFGMFTVSFFVVDSSGGRSVYSVLVKFTNLPLFTFLPLLPPTPAPSVINTFKTPPYTFESLFIPQLSGSLVYNFYEPTEEDYEIYKSRNYTGAKLTDIPKYIRLTWNKPGIFQLQQIITPRITIDATGGPASDSGTSAARQDSQGNLLGAVAGQIGGDYGGGSTGMPGITALNIGGFVVSLPAVDEMSTAVGGGGTRSSADYQRLFDVDGGTSGLDGTVDDDAVMPMRTGGTIDGEGSGGDFHTALSEGPRDIVPDFDANLYTKSEYIGYVIQKNRISQEGESTIVDLIAVNGKEITEFIDWKIAYGEVYQYQIRSIFRFVNKDNINIYFDSDSLLNGAQTNQFVDNFRFSVTNPAYYYDSEFSNLLEFPVQEFERPESPYNIKIYPNSKNKTLFISWNQKNQDRDVVGYNVYRRKAGTKFIKLNGALLDVRNNKYVDYDLEKEQEYIYAVESVDFHGNFSKMSAQFSCKIVSYNNFSNTFCEEKQKLISSESIELGQELLEAEPDDILIFKKKINLNINPLFNNVYDKDYFVIKVTSLDTGLTKQLKINFNNMTIYHVRGYTPPPSPFVYLPLGADAVRGLFGRM